MGSRAGWLATFALALACGQTARNRQPSPRPDTGSAGDAASGGSSSDEAGTTSRPPDTGGAEMGSGGVSAGGSLAGEAGEGGNSSLPCDVRVPEDVPRVSLAVERLPEGGTVCLDPGTYFAPFELNGSINLRGSPASVLCGDLLVHAAADASGPPPAQTLSGFKLFGRIDIEGSRDVELHGVQVEHDPDAAIAAGCLTPSYADLGIKLTALAGYGPQRVLIEDCRFSGAGAQVFVSGPGQLELEVTMRRSGCLASQCWDLLHVDWESALLPGSRLRILAENNISTNTVLEAFLFNGDPLPEADAAASFIHVLGNTIYSPGDPNYGIATWSAHNIPTVIANNAIGDLGIPIHPEVSVAEVSHNLLSKPNQDVGAAAWYVDAAAGDFHPAPGSPLRAAADKAWLPQDDFFGNPRTSADIGAVAAP